MYINRKLDIDPVLFKDFVNKKSKAKIIKSLNNVGIFTVKDLIEADENKFSPQSRKKYKAIAYILSHEYLGTEFPYEDILCKSYVFSDELFKCATDLETLGVVRDAKGSMPFLYLSTANYTGKTISTNYVLNNYYYDRSDLARYYINYIKIHGLQENIADKTNVVANNYVTLQNLIIEINTLMSVLNDLNNYIDQNPSIALINFRTTLEVQIKDKQNALSALEEKGFTRSR